MKMQDIISSIIDLIGHATEPVEQEPEQVILVAEPAEKPGTESPFTNTGDDVNRFRQIIDLIDTNDDATFANEPDEKYADIDSVTVNAGGGMNGPKHPHDVRVKDPSAYPNQQEC